VVVHWWMEMLRALERELKIGTGCAWFRVSTGRASEDGGAPLRYCYVCGFWEGGIGWSEILWQRPEARQRQKCMEY
jgi:hypothetical protein